MQDAGLAVYMAGQRHAALRQIAAEVNALRYLPVMGIMTLAGVALTAPLVIAAPQYAVLSLLALLAGASTLYRWVPKRQIDALLPQLRAEIEHNLTAGGLMVLALDDEAADQLPRLFGPPYLSRARLIGSQQRRTVRGRLTALAATYIDCCEDAGLSTHVVQQYQALTRREARHSDLIRHLVTVELAEALAGRSEPEAVISER